MASFSADLGAMDYWDNPANTMYGTLSGDVTRSGNTVTLSNLTLSIVSVQTSWGTSPGWTFRVNDVATTVTLNAPPTSIGVNGTSISVSGSATSASIPWSVDGANSGNFTVTFPSGAPSGLNVTNITPGTDSITATVLVTAWNGGDASTRYRELQVWTYSASGLVEPMRFKTDTGSILLSNITVDNNSPGGTLTLVPNTRYVIGGYASNGNANTGSVRFGVSVTLAEMPTVTVEGTTNDSATLAYSVPADGGFYDKTIEYSLDNGATWNTIANVQGGGATSGTYTITGLTPGEHTVLVRSRTTSGSAGNVSLTFTTAAVRIIASDGTTGREALSVLVSVNGIATEGTRLLVSHNGVATENA